MRIRVAFRLALALSLLVHVCMGCGSSGGEGPSLQDIPRYPNATPGESMAGSSPGGMVSGNLAQFRTTDSFDQVLDFYTEALREYDPQLLSNRSELGRQSAFSIRQKSGMTTVVIQEFVEEGSVNITLMAVGG
jgi:hypothetical protein